MAEHEDVQALVARLRAVHAEMTPGEWEAYGESVEHVDGGVITSSIGAHNATGIAAMHNAAPALLDALDRLTADNAALVEALDELTLQCGWCSAKAEWAWADSYGDEGAGTVAACDEHVGNLPDGYGPVLDRHKVRELAADHPGRALLEERDRLLAEVRAAAEEQLLLSTQLLEVSKAAGLERTRADGLDAYLTAIATRLAADGPDALEAALTALIARAETAEALLTVCCGDCQGSCMLPDGATRCYYCKTWYCNERCSAVHFGLHEIEDRKMQATIARAEAAEEEVVRLRKAAQLALHWCSGTGPYTSGKDTIKALAEEVAPALADAIAATEP